MKFWKNRFFNRSAAPVPRVREIRPQRGISRRTVLRGAAVSMALPFLPSALTRSVRAAGGPESPRRLLFYYVPNGIQMDWWTPTTEGPGYDLPEILEPLAPIQDKVNVLSGLGNAPARVPVAGDHARGTGSFLTCRTVNHSVSEIVNGISVDQVAAQALGGETVFPSLELGLVGGSNVGDCDNGYSCAYQRNISWAGPATPLPKLTDPQLVFNRLFGGVDPNLTEEEIARRKVLRTSVLDYVLDDANSLHTRLSPSDQAKLDEYMNGVRELEMRIQAQDQAACLPPQEPGGGLDLVQRIQAMNELMVMALRCDMTRVVSFMFGNGGSGQNYSFIGAPGGHHEFSHHQGDPANLQSLRIIDRWEVEQFSDLLLRMDAVDEGNGCTLLDNSLVYFSSEIEDGNSHSHFNLPVLLAGSGGGTVTPGRHVRYTGDEPMANLFISMLQSFGVEVENFGDDGTRPLGNLVV